MSYSWRVLIVVSVRLELLDPLQLDDEVGADEAVHVVQDPAEQQPVAVVRLGQDGPLENYAGR